MASGLARGRVRTTTTTVESRKDGGHPPNNRLTGTWRLGLQCTSLTLDIHVMINWHLSKQGICWPVSRNHIAGLSSFIKVCVFFEVDRWPSANFSIGLRAHARLTCWKQDRIVRKPVNANPGLKFIRIITRLKSKFFLFLAGFNWALKSPGKELRF